MPTQPDRQRRVGRADLLSDDSVVEQDLQRKQKEVGIQRRSGRAVGVLQEIRSERQVRR